jgi:4-amino-4-deoxy-L-arabinose transferase-like glycosyltransferase
VVNGTSGDRGPKDETPPRGSRAGRVLCALGLGVILTFSAAAALYGIAGPLAWGHHGHHVGNHGNDARHLLRDGTMVQQWDAGYHTPKGNYYLHAPILMHQYIALSMALLGWHAFAVRAVPATFTLLIVVLVFLGGRRAWGSGAGLVAAAVFATLPMVVSYNILPAHLHAGVLYTLAGFYGYLSWLETRRTRHLVLGLLGFLLAAFSDWPPYLIVGFLGLYALIRAAIRRSVVELLGVVALALVFAVPFGVHVVLVKVLNALPDLESAFHQRSGGPDAARITKVAIHYQDLMFTKAVVAVGLLWLLSVVVRAPLRMLSRWHLIPLAFLLGQTVFVYAFKQGIWVHIYLVYYVSVTYAFAAGDLAGLAVRGLRAIGAARLWAPLPAVVTGLLAVALLGAEARAAAPVFLESRQRGGAIGHAGHQPDLERLVFGQLVHDATGPETLVLIHPSLRARYEFHWYLDRDVVAANAVAEPSARKGEAPRGKVLLFADGAPAPALPALLRRFPVTRYGPFVMVDFRRPEARYRAFKMTSEPVKGALARYLGGPHERTWKLTRDLDEEWRTVLAHGLPAEDRPPPADRPRAGDREGWERRAEIMAALGRPYEALRARTEILKGMRPLPADLGDGLELDGVEIRRGQPLKVLLHAGAERPLPFDHALVLDLVRDWPPPPAPRFARAPLEGVRLRSAMPPATSVRALPIVKAPPLRAPLLDPGPAKPGANGYARLELPLTPSTTLWPQGRAKLVSWPLGLAPGRYQAQLSLRIPGRPAHATPPQAGPEIAPVDLGLIDVP